MTEEKIRQALAENIMRQSPEAMVVHELGILAGNRRLDLAALTGQLHGYEIKSASDSLARLEGQARDISRVADLATLTCAPNHTKNAGPKIPGWWEIIEASEDADGEIVLTQLRPGTANPAQDPHAVAQLMWRAHALEELKKLGKAKGLSKKARHYIWEALTQATSLEEIRAMALKWVITQQESLKQVVNRDESEKG